MRTKSAAAVDRWGSVSRSSLAKGGSAALLGVILLTTLAGELRAGDRGAYLRDLEFLEETVGRRSPMVVARGVPWRDICRDARRVFGEAADDDEHRANVRRLLAQLRDPQSRLIEPLPVDAGLGGGGGWFEVESGRLLLAEWPAEHPLVDALPTGSVVTAIDGEPTWLVLDRVRRRLARELGDEGSGDAFWARHGHRLLPFDGREQVVLEIRETGSEPREVVLPAVEESFHPVADRLPTSVTWSGGATAATERRRWARKGVAYLRPTEDLSESVLGSCHRTFDAVGDVDAVILDLRGIGGSDPACAIELLGRFYAEPREVAGIRIVPVGKKPFAGPLVVLCDGATREAAELVVGIVAQTHRGVTIGRRTAGWSRPTARFETPGKKIAFQLTIGFEGAGQSVLPEDGAHRPDLEVPPGIAYRTLPDATLQLADEVLAANIAGLGRVAVVELFTPLLSGGDPAAFVKRVDKLGKKVRWRPHAILLGRYRQNLARSAESEIDLLTATGPYPPDFLGAAIRIESLYPRLRKAGFDDAAKELGRLRRGGFFAELKAQTDLLDALAGRDALERSEARRFAEDHGDTRVGEYVNQRWNK